MRTPTFKAWWPAKGEVVYVFRWKTRRVKKAKVKYVSGKGIVMLYTPDGEPGAYKLEEVGRTPEEALEKERIIALAYKDLWDERARFLERKGKKA